MSTGLLILRIVAGLLLAAHGSQKLFGWFGGYGIAGTGGWLESIGFKPGKAMAVVTGLPRDLPPSPPRRSSALPASPSSSAASPSRSAC